MADTQQTVDKLKLLTELAKDNEVRALCNILIDYISEKEPLGFKGNRPEPSQPQTVRKS